jgi:Protein of unknown function (DUF5672)
MSLPDHHEGEPRRAQPAGAPKTAPPPGTALPSLPAVTLCCIDTRYPALGAWALAHSLGQARFADALLFTDPARAPQSDVRWRVVPAEITSMAAYSEFMHRGLAAHVHSSHALVVQWDGLIRDASCWDPAFLEWDYIGAPWPGVGPDRAVGNGGFSLRSRRLLQALLDPRVQITHPEDVSICVTNRALLERQHGMRFAPLAVAERFAYERTRPPVPTFGFHGMHNLKRELPAGMLAGFVQSLPPDLTRTKEAVDLCRALIEAGDLDLAAALVGKRREAGLHGSRTLRLAWRLAWARWRR